MAMPAKQDLIDYFLAHQFKYFYIEKCDICNEGDQSLFANGGGVFKRGSTCRCLGKNEAISWDVLDFYLDPENGWEDDIIAYMED